MSKPIHRERPSAPLILKFLTLGAFLLLYVPLIAMGVFSFLKTSQGVGSELIFTYEWYEKVFSNETILNALYTSLWVAFAATIGATFLGTFAALAFERYEFPGKKLIESLTLLPLAMPELVMGLSLLIWFVFLKITLGQVSMILAHITFSASYVLITVRARLQDFDRSLEEAAKDLGASSVQTFLRVTLPLIMPGVVCGALMAFTLSFDDFLVSFFTAGVETETLPVKIYSMTKFGISPEINALSTMILAATVVLVLSFFSPMIKSTKTITD